MPHEHKPYDKIIRENIGEFFLSISEKYLGISIAKSEELKDKLETTLEREADFLRIIYTKQGEKFVLHLEFQTNNEANMIYRMQEYFAILQKKYQLPVRQFVIYLGEEKVNMRNKLEQQEIFVGFELLDLKKYSYQEFLDSPIPEEIILAILCDFEQEKVEDVLQKILSSLQKTSKDRLALERYIKQILVFSRLRALTSITEKQLKNMALVYDIEKDPFYVRGEEKGIEKGTSQTKVQGIQKALQQQILTLQQIADLFDVPLSFVKEVQQKMDK